MFGANRRGAVRQGPLAAWSIAGALLLGACGGGSGSGSSLGFGGNQNPDPVVVDFPLAYVKRPLLLDQNGDLLTADVREPHAFLPGAELFLRDRVSPSAAERSLTAGVFPNDAMGNPPLYDVKDLSPSFDGRKLVFAMRAPEDPNLDEDEQPSWNIWVYDVDDDELRRVIASDIVAEVGQDVAPRFLPDGRIVFASTRQRQSKAILLDEGKPQFTALEEGRDDYAFTLHVMNADGTGIEQISFNQSHDFDPAVLPDGRLVYSRWDQVAGRNRISLYRMNPDGSGQELLYGVHSHDTGPNGTTIEFVKAQPLPDDRLLVALRPRQGDARMGAALVAIDTEQFIDNDRPTHANAGLVTTAQELLIAGSISLDATPSPRGRFAAAYPLFDGTDRVVVAWSQCRLLDPASPPDAPRIVPCTPNLLAIPGIQEAPPLYGVWMFDSAHGTQQPIVTGQEGFAFSEAVVLEDRTDPPVILDKVPGLDVDADLAAAGAGVIHIRNVYELDGASTANIEVLRDPAQTTAAERPRRFLRIEKPVSLPDDDLVDLPGTAFGVSQAQLMREIIGYAPVEPDGSVKLKVPADIAFAVSVLDANGRRLTPRHQHWLQLRAGEVKECNGCHTAQSRFPHGRLDAEPPSTNTGAPVDGSPFPNTEPALFADTGETMAEVYTRFHGVPDPNVDIEFVDVWTDPTVREKDASFAYRYADLTTPAPTALGCASEWVASCRIVVNYEMHIQPLWDAPRPVFDADDNLIANHTCTSCHGPLDEMGATQVPAGQLDLTGEPSPDQAAHFVSYRELFFNDNEQELVDGALLDRLVPVFDGNGNQVFQTDGQGNLILDANGDPIPVLVTVNVSPSLSPAGALASPRFFSRFAPGGTHEGRLNGAELKLVSEWVDIGAQYFNDPFAVPQD
jgi:hypothetical protein